MAQPGKNTYPSFGWSWVQTSAKAMAQLHALKVVHTAAMSDARH